ncbi:uncharacterized [Tachysurus ichikawai]
MFQSPSELLIGRLLVTACPLPAKSDKLLENVFHTQLMDVTHRGLKRLFITDSSRDPVGRLHLLPLPVTDKLVHWLKDGMRVQG